MQSPPSSDSEVRSPSPIFIVGPGAVGLSLGILTSARYPVTFVATERRARELYAQPLAVCGALDRKITAGTIPVTTANSLPRELKRAQFWITVKAHDLRSALQSISPAVDSSSIVVLFPNGLAIDAEARDILPKGTQIIRALPSFGVYLDTSTNAVLAGGPRVALAADASKAPALKALGELLTGVGVTVSTEHDVQVAEWRKARVNMIVNTLCSLSGDINGALRHKKALRRHLRNLLGEIGEVANAAAISLEPLSEDELLSLIEPHASNRNSMLVDLQARRGTEIAAISGRFLATAKNYGIPTPLSRALFYSIQALETSRRGAKDAETSERPLPLLS
jgi:2-dehydropantoate 2-reductase